MADATVCDGCSGSVQHSSNLNTTYDVPWMVFLHEDSVCVRFVNDTATNVSVNTWVEDTEGNGDVSDSSFSTPVPPGGEVAVCFAGFGYEADQTTPISECLLHTVLHDDDAESEGVEIYHEVY